MCHIMLYVPTKKLKKKILVSIEMLYLYDEVERRRARILTIGFVFHDDDDPSKNRNNTINKKKFKKIKSHYD